MTKKKIKYSVTFELENYEKMVKSYPNFSLNYGSFEEWAQSNIDYMVGSIADIDGIKVKSEKLS